MICHLTHRAPMSVGPSGSQSWGLVEVEASLWLPLEYSPRKCHITTLPSRVPAHHNRTVGTPDDYDLVPHTRRFLWVLMKGHDLVPHTRIKLPIGIDDKIPFALGVLPRKCHITTLPSRVPAHHAPPLLSVSFYLFLTLLLFPIVHLLISYQRAHPRRGIAGWG
jgi:hypothetical protein